MARKKRERSLDFQQPTSTLQAMQQLKQNLKIIMDDRKRKKLKYSFACEDRSNVAYIGFWYKDDKPRASEHKVNGMELCIVELAGFMRKCFSWFSVKTEPCVSGKMMFSFTFK